MNLDNLFWFLIAMLACSIFRVEAFELTQTKSIPVYEYQSNLKTLDQIEVESKQRKALLNTCLDRAEKLTGDQRDYLIDQCCCEIMGHQESCNE